MLAEARVINGAVLLIDPKITFLSVCLTLIVTTHARAEIKPVPLVQQTLGGLGFDAGAADGIWGQKSISALKAFQRSKSLNPSGVIDPITLHELFPNTPDTAASSTPDTPSVLPAIGSTTLSEPPTTPKATQEELGTPSWTDDTSDASRSKPAGEGSAVAKFLCIVIVLVAIMAFRGRSKKNAATRKGRRSG